jgi:hypothetical protein
MTRNKMAGSLSNLVFLMTRSLFLYKSFGNLVTRNKTEWSLGNLVFSVMFLESIGHLMFFGHASYDKKF